MSTALARGSERLNPVLLKEVRAALRGRWFRSTFAIVLSLALVASLGFLMFSTGDPNEPRGAQYFAVVSGCMAFGVHGLVPFSAMLSMSAESDEHTLELLQLSGVSGWRIVIGKLGSALLQMLLIMSAFAPFLTMAFLLRGVDASAIALMLGFSVLTCAAQCSVGLMLGSIARARWARILLMLVFAVFLLQFTQIGLLFLVGGAALSGMGGPTVGWGSTGAAVAMVGVSVTFLFCAVSAGRLTHVEENRSTPGRVAVSLLVLTGIGIGACQSSPNGAAVALAITLTCAAPLMLFLATEQERLPRAVAAHLPRWSRAFPMQAWLPGGGNGALFVLVHVAAVFAALLFVSALRFPRAAPWGVTCLFLAGVIMNVVVFVLLPGAVMSNVTRKPGGRIAVRVVSLLFFSAANLGPAILAFLVDDPSLAHWSPIEAAIQIGEHKSYQLPYGALVLLSIATLLANIPRIADSVRAVGRESRHARKPDTNAAPVA